MTHLGPRGAGRLEQVTGLHRRRSGYLPAALLDPPLRLGGVGASATRSRPLRRGLPAVAGRPPAARKRPLACFTFLMFFRLDFGVGWVAGPRLRQPIEADTVVRVHPGAATFLERHTGPFRCPQSRKPTRSSSYVSFFVARRQCTSSARWKSPLTAKERRPPPHGVGAR